MKARFSSKCSCCGDQISQGKEISKGEAGEWVHKHCAPDSAEIP